MPLQKRAFDGGASHLEILDSRSGGGGAPRYIAQQPGYLGELLSIWAGYSTTWSITEAMKRLRRDVILP